MDWTIWGNSHCFLDRLLVLLYEGQSHGDEKWTTRYGVASRLRIAICFSTFRCSWYLALHELARTIGIFFKPINV